MLIQRQTFLDTFICQANANATEYFFFEVRCRVSHGRAWRLTLFLVQFYDEEWKARLHAVGN